MIEMFILYHTKLYICNIKTIDISTNYSSEKNTIQAIFFKQNVLNCSFIKNNTMYTVKSNDFFYYAGKSP